MSFSSELLDCRRSVFFGAEVERLLDEVDAGLFDDESQGALAVVVVCLYLRRLNISCGEAARPALAGYGKRAVRSSPYFVSAFLLSSKAFFVPSKMNFLSVGTDFSSRVLRSPSSVPQITFETFSVLRIS